MPNRDYLSIRAADGRIAEGTITGRPTLLDAIREAGFDFDAPCGGQGLCGKCLVALEAADGRRTVPACRTIAEPGMRVTLLPPGDARILTEGSGPCAGEEEREDGTYALSFDIGTTTIAGYLAALPAGRVLIAKGALNPQAAFGADVIARISYANEQGGLALTSAIRGKLSELSLELLAEAGVLPEKVRAVCIVGNSCMQQLFLGLPTDSLGVSPYAPATLEPKICPAADYGFPVHPSAKLYVPGLIGGFVGSDTVACLLSQGFDVSEKLRLLIDVGTNGELVLGNRRRRIACSAAAGPAFEGANIRFGMRAETGAVDQLILNEDGSLSLSVIGGGVAKGVCGSGLIDAVSTMLKLGALTPGGRLLKKAEAENLGLPCARRLVPFEGGTAFALTEQVFITQADVRAVQLSKAAIRTGIDCLLDQFGVSARDISETLLAGAFGSFLRPASALRIGLFPAECSKGLRVVGNAAGSGAMMIAASPVAFERANRLAASTAHLELSGNPDFQEAFISMLSFPDTGREA